jgi:hypothetical protein
MIALAPLLVSACGTTGPAAAQPPAPAASSAVATSAPTPTIDVPRLRDSRRLRGEPREKGLLVREITDLEAQLANVPPSSPDHVARLRALADDYVELEVQAMRGERSDIASRARINAEKYYTGIVVASPDDPHIDEVLYYLAYECELGDEADKSRKIYYQLIARHPQSRLVSKAYLAFAELFVKESLIDPSKKELAKQAYAQVLKYPAGPNDVYAYASYRLGQLTNEGGPSEFARDLLKKAIETAEANPQLPNSAAIAEAARRELSK